MQQLYKCPLCDESKETSNKIYSHLMTQHRKSTLSRELMEAKL